MHFTKMELAIILIATLTDQELVKKIYQHFIEECDKYDPTEITTGMAGLAVFNEDPPIDLIVSTARMMVGLTVSDRLREGSTE